MYADEGLRCLYSILLTGGLKLKGSSVTDTNITVFSDTGHIILDYKDKTFRVQNNIFYGRVILPAVGNYYVDVRGNIFNELLQEAQRPLL